MSELSIIICTRNRIEDLTRLIRSISVQQKLEGDAVELLIVDDGNIPEEVLGEFRSLLSRLSGSRVVYYKKSKPGVWLSRYEALSMVQYDIVLYFDDDAELDDPLYIRRLLDTYHQDERIVGVGGIAKGLSTSRAGKLLGILTFQMSASLGRLSVSGLAGSLLRWHEAEQPFRTEFFHGCNMSFRRKALKDMLPYPWMTSYAVADDLYMCHLASQYGTLIIDPSLQILHHESPRSRDNAGRVAKATAVNHYYFLNLKQAGMRHYVALLWTLTYLMGKESLKRNFNAVKGYAAGMLFVLNPRKESYKEYMNARLSPEKA
ncbi:glycosyltransferase family 2 protein [Paenibacillus massiliensis]|uniref:glycosyltransferase family 2 protein n=1 Tax=Paenibacillus massiliensis TaxID=225917 RepID=UPI000472B56A|nr:glycosyltransferase family 2 protein [Paenibacillus massiliensis]